MVTGASKGVGKGVALGLGEAGCDVAVNYFTDRKGGEDTVGQLGAGANKAPFPNLSAYNASKGGINMLTAVSAVELGPFGITVNCVAPGTIEVERTKRESPDYAEAWWPITPMRRVGCPTDVAHAVRFLASDDAAFITGQVLYVDGGLWSQVPWPYT